MRCKSPRLDATHRLTLGLRSAISTTKGEARKLLQVDLDLGFIQVVALGAHLLGVIAPVTRLELMVQARRGDARFNAGFFQAAIARRLSSVPSRWLLSR